MAFKDGRAARIWCNEVRASRFLTSFDLARQVGTEDVSVFEDDDKQFIALQTDADIGMEGNVDGSTEQIHALLETALGSTSPQAWTLCLDGPSVGSPAHLWPSFNSEFNVKSPAAGKVAVSGGSKPAGPVLVGKSLLSGITARTSTVASTPTTHSAAAGSTGGATVHFHLTDASTLASITVKLQHSSNNGTYTDLATFTSTAVGSQRSTVAGTIKKNVRAAITAFSGGAGKSVKIQVAFARS